MIRRITYAIGVRNAIGFLGLLSCGDRNSPYAPSSNNSAAQPGSPITMEFGGEVGGPSGHEGLAVVGDRLPPR